MKKEEFDPVAACKNRIDYSIFNNLPIEFDLQRNNFQCFIKRVLYTLALILGLSVCGCQKESSETHVESITISASSVTIGEGETYTLTATVSPDKASNKKILWTTSDASIASVDNGKVSAIKEGKATITAKSDDGGKTAACQINVNKKIVAVSGVSLDKECIELSIGDETTLSATVKPDNATDKAISWKSSDEAIALVTDGKVKALKKGNATITVTTFDGNKTASCSVNVNEKIIHVESVSLDITSVTLNVGDKATLVATVLPENASNKNIIWSSSNENVASVSNGRVNVYTPGTATIYAKSEDGDKTATCSILVNEASSIITFADNTVKAICVNNWDKNNDGELSKDEAELVFEIGTVFKGRRIKSFNEFKYFTAVQNIPSEAFYECSYLESIELPQGMIEIGDYAFYACDHLKELSIPNSVESFGVGSFNGCEELSNINIPPRITEIPDNCFCWNFALSHIAIPEGVYYIGDKAFAYVTELKELELPSTIEAIGAGAFEESGIQSIVIPEGVECLSEGIFAASGLRQITLPSTIRWIQDYAFTNCGNLQSINLPSKLNTIGSYAFSGCISLSDISIPQGVESVGDAAFKYAGIISIKVPESIHCIASSMFSECEHLTNVELPSTITSIGDGAFSGCSSLSKINLPSSLYTIGRAAFYGCTSLTQIKLPDNLIKIEESAFYNVNIKTWEVPSTVNNIGRYAFPFGMEELTVRADEPPHRDCFIDSAFSYYYPALKHIYVPNQSINKYKSSPYWCNLSSYLFPMQ